MAHELPPELHSRITARAAEGDALAEKGEYEAAIRVYNEAWEAVSEPKNEWEASTWLLGAIGDACFLGGFFGSGLDAFGYAVHCPGGFGNPFIHLRLGQCHLEKGQVDEAAEHLTRAYALEGKDIFAAEDPKYFAFLKTRIAPPAGGQW
jgi:tetratricopeptide (TPR) repeat protein